MELLLSLRNNPLVYMAVVLLGAWFFHSLIFGRFSGSIQTHPSASARSKDATSITSYMRGDQPQPTDPPPFC